MRASRERRPHDPELPDVVCAPPAQCGGRRHAPRTADPELLVVHGDLGAAPATL